jgi:hypothetical protein
MSSPVICFYIIKLEYLLKAIILNIPVILLKNNKNSSKKEIRIMYLPVKKKTAREEGNSGSRRITNLRRSKEEVFSTQIRSTNFKKFF